MATAMPSYYALLSLVLNYPLNIGVTLSNKAFFRVLSFQLPVTLAAIHMLFCAVLPRVLMRCGLEGGAERRAGASSHANATCNRRGRSASRAAISWLTASRVGVVAGVGPPHCHEQHWAALGVRAPVCAGQVRGPRVVSALVVDPART